MAHWVINECPHCHRYLEHDNRFGKNQTIIGVCPNCGHLIWFISSEVDNVEYCQSCVVEREWIMGNTKEERKELYEFQEEEHFKSGRWG
jgi:hypothetical protein